MSSLLRTVYKLLMTLLGLFVAGTLALTLVLIILFAVDPNKWLCVDVALSKKVEINRKQQRMVTEAIAFTMVAVFNLAAVWGIVLSAFWPSRRLRFTRALLPVTLLGMCAVTLLITPPAIQLQLPSFVCEQSVSGQDLSDGAEWTRWFCFGVLANMASSVAVCLLALLTSDSRNGTRKHPNQPNGRTPLIALNTQTDSSLSSYTGGTIRSIGGPLIPTNHGPYGNSNRAFNDRDFDDKDGSGSSDKRSSLEPTPPLIQLRRPRRVPVPPPMVQTSPADINGRHSLYGRPPPLHRHDSNPYHEVNFLPPPPPEEIRAATIGAGDRHRNHQQMSPIRRQQQLQNSDHERWAFSNRGPKRNSQSFLPISTALPTGSGLVMMTSNGEAFEPGHSQSNSDGSFYSPAITASDAAPLTATIESTGGHM